MDGGKSVGNHLWSLRTKQRVGVEGVGVGGGSRDRRNQLKSLSKNGWTNQSARGRGRGGLSNRFILKLPEAQVNLPHRTAPCALEPGALEQLSRPEGTEKGELRTEMYKVSLEEPVHTSAQALSLSQHERNAARSALCFCFLVYLPRLHFTSLASRRSRLSLPTGRVGAGLRGDTISTSILVCQTLLLTFLFAW